MAAKKGTLVTVAVILLAALTAGGILLYMESAPAGEPPIKTVREPAVAGLFYPKDQAELTRMVDDLLAKAKSTSIGELRGLVCPHAGYPFSGPTAAIGFRTLIGRDIRTVVILGPSHYAVMHDPIERAEFTGAAIPDVDAYRTPLGLVRLSPKAKALAKVEPFHADKPAPIQRPDFWPQSSRAAPAAGQDTPDTWEHSIEVEIPFLQRTLKEFSIVPAVFSQRVDPAEAAKAVAGVLDDSTLVIASSDLSHYYNYDKARELDQRCVSAICDMDFDKAKVQEACGNLPIMTLMHLAKAKGWKPRLLDCRNSGDVVGNKDRVVGYAAIAFYDPAGLENLSADERKTLLELARKTLKQIVAKGEPVGDMDESKLPRQLKENKGCFVTLTRDEQLRGCMGDILPTRPLYKAVMERTRSATVEDPRFADSRIRPDELDKIEIEISVLTVPELLLFGSPEDLLAKLRPHRDGVLLQIGQRGATYLPQVWEQIPDKTKFMDSLAAKAGCAPGDWRKPGALVHIYHVESFKESGK